MKMIPRSKFFMTGEERLPFSHWAVSRFDRKYIHDDIVADVGSYTMAQINSIVTTDVLEAIIDQITDDIKGVS